MKSIKLLLLFIIILINSGFSQTKSIFVFDTKTNEVIPFVNVQIKNTKTGWSGDENGMIKIDFSKIELTDSLIFSAVGYDKKTIEYALIHTLSRIELNPSSVYLNEVKIKARRYKRARLGRKKADKNWGGSSLGKQNLNRKFKKKSLGLKSIDNSFREAKFIPNDIGADGIIRELRVYIRFGSIFPFELDVMGVNSLDGSPSISLLKEPIKCVAKKDKKWLTVDVKKNNIHIPKEGFFIVINFKEDSVNPLPVNYYTNFYYYSEEKEKRVDTIFYKGTVIGNTYDKEPNWWVNNDSTWRNYWQRTINFRDTCVQCLIKYPDTKKHNLRTSNKQTLAVYANILYSKSAKKYEENILDKEGIVNEKDKKELLIKTYEYQEKLPYLYPQGDVFQLFESIKRALDSNNMNYIAHHFLSYTYESIDGFDLELNKMRRRQIIYDIEDIMKQREKLKLTKEGNGFYFFDFNKKIGGRLLLKNGKWTMMVEMKSRRI